MEARATAHNRTLLPTGGDPALSPQAPDSTVLVPGSRLPGDRTRSPHPAGFGTDDPACGSTVTTPGRSQPDHTEGERVEGDSDPDVVLLTLPANSVYLSVLRTATAGLAARLHFTLDEIEDLRIAVDEACAMLLAGQELPDAELRCRFTLAPDEIAVTVTLPGIQRSVPAQNTFAWQVLTALTGEVDAEVINDQLTIGLVKRRSRSS